MGTFARGAANRLLQTPLNTLFVNLTGCFLVGLFDSWMLRRGVSARAQLLLITGFCGAFTTFSSLIFDLDALFKQSPVRALAYVLISLGGGLAMLRAGAALGR